MWRVLAAVVIIGFLVAFARWQNENPPRSIAEPNRVSDQVAETIAGPSVRARATAKHTVHEVNDTRQQQLDELNKF